MNQSYLNGQFHEFIKRFRRTEESTSDQEGTHFLRSTLYTFLRIYNYCHNGFFVIYIRYLWSQPDGPDFIVKLLMLFLDAWFQRLYSFNRNPICRSNNHSSVLSKKQNIGWFL